MEIYFRDSLLPVGIQEENGIEFQVQVYEKQEV